MNTRANIEKINLKLEGMSCASCANSVERTINNVARVFECNIDFGAQKAAIQYDSIKISLKKIRDAIDRACYSSYSLPSQAIA